MSTSFLPANIDLRPKSAVTEEEAKMIWLEARKPSVAMLLKTLWYTGLRIGEVLLLRVSDIRRDGLNFSLTVYTEKLGQGKKLEERKPDLLPIPRSYGLDLYDYIQSQGLKGTDRLFPMHRATAWRQVQACARRAGLPNWRDIHPHSFRHGFIYDKASKGVHPYILSRLARHRELKITLGYYQPTEDDLRQAMES
jgi:integrase